MAKFEFGHAARVRMQTDLREQATGDRIHSSYVRGTVYGMDGRGGSAPSLLSGKYLLTFRSVLDPTFF